MASVVFYASNREMMQTARQALAENHPDIRVVGGRAGGGADMAARLVDNGAEVIIARGGKATDIRESGLPVSVVELRVDAFDLVDALGQAKKHGTRIAAVAFPNLINGVERLAGVLGVKIETYFLRRREDPSASLKAALAAGAQVVIGGPVTIAAASEMDFPAVLIENTTQSILHAAEEAKLIAAAQKRERARNALYTSLIDHATEGMIGIDPDFRVFAFNPMAERILGMRRDTAVGREIHKVWPELGLDSAMVSGRDERGRMLSINGKDVLCNKTVIVKGVRAVAAVATFQDASNIQRMEQRVRRRIYGTGHTASATLGSILGTSPATRKAVRVAERYARTGSSVLILGETGTGKELFAQGIHNHSNRRNGPFVPINCAAVPRELLESELFGYLSGAFTGASPKGKRGLFEQAHQGTLFLDEITEMDLGLQGKLLRALQERTVLPLGGDRPVHVDVRIIAATNRDIKESVAGHGFRPDLYYRLNVLRLRIPPLRERTEDIGLLAQHFLGQATGHGRHSPRLSRAAVADLEQYSWPGNVRELQSLMERVAALYTDSVIGREHIESLWADEDIAPTRPGPVRDEESEAYVIRRALVQNRHRMGETAKQLGISRSTLWRRMKRLGIEE